MLTPCDVPTKVLPSSKSKQNSIQQTLKHWPKHYASTEGFVSSAERDKESEGGERVSGRKEKEEKKVCEELAQKAKVG